MKKIILIMLMTSIMLQPANIIRLNIDTIGDPGELPVPEPIVRLISEKV